MKLRRPMTVLAALAFAFSTLIAGPTVSPVYAGAGGNCDFFDVPDNMFGFLTVPEANIWKTMVQADIYTDPARFTPCVNPTLYDHGGISQWISLDFPTASHNNIVQIGVIKCNQPNGSNPPASSACSNTNYGSLNYFYAYGHDNEGSCGWGDKSPTPVYLGTVTTAGWHNFKIQYKVATDRVWFLRDGNLVANIDAGAYCFLNSRSTRATYSVERWDANDGATALHFDNTRYEKNDDGVTRVASWTLQSQCNLDPEFTCARYQTYNDHWTFSAN